MYIYFTHWIIIQYNATYFVAQMVLALATESSFRLGFSPFDMLSPFWWGGGEERKRGTYYLALDQAPNSSCIFLDSALESVISPRSPGSSMGDWYLETKIWFLDVSICF